MHFGNPASELGGWSAAVIARQGSIVFDVHRTLFVRAASLSHGLET